MANVTHHEGFFKGVRDADVYYQYWLPAAEPKAALLIVHGLGEHSGRYGNVVDRLAPLGYAVYGMDHLGHGRSAGVRMHVERFTDFTDTLAAYLDMVRHWQPGKPIFLMGHSMGGLIAALGLLDNQAKLAGAILSGPAAKAPADVSPAIALTGRLLAVLLPKFRILALEPEGISRDQSVVQAYIDDPLVYAGKMTARLGAEFLRGMARINAGVGAITLPILVLQGGSDRMVNPAGASMLYEGASSSDKTLRVYDGLYHEVFNEPERKQVLDDVAAWLEARC